MKRVLIISAHTIENDNRILSELDTLVRNGIESGVISRGEKFQERSDIFQYCSRRKGVFGALEFYFKVIEYIKNFKPTHIQLCDADTLPVYWLLKKKKRDYVWIYDAHELEFNRAGQSRLQGAIIFCLEQLSLKSFKHLITVSQSIANIYARLYDKEVLVVPNAPSKALLTTKAKVPADIDAFMASSPTLIYQGYLQKGRGIEKLISDADAITSLGINILFMGSGGLYEKISQISRQNHKVKVIPLMPRESYLAITKAASFGYCVIETVSESDRLSLPNKVLEYLACGLPVLVSDMPELKALVQKFEIGVIYNLERDNLVSKSEELLLNFREMRSNAEKYRNEAMWENSQDTYLKAFSND